MKKLLLTMIVSFVLCGTMFAQTYSTHWPDFDYHQYADNKGLVAYVKVDGQFADADTYQRYEVAAFVGNECRGASFLQDETGLGDAHPAFQMQVYYNAQEGQEEQLSFKLYDHVDSVEYSSCTPKFFSTGVATTLYTDNWYLGVWGEPDSNQAIVLDFTTAVTQTIQLESGKNWISVNVEVSLDELKAALVASVNSSGITIVAQDGNTTWNGRRWSTSSLTWDVTKKYIITVPVSCEIALEGMPVNLDEHLITISQGSNWIGYPLSEVMTITSAFAGFATNGDMIKSQDGNSSYARNRWSNNFSLEPGKGYTYVSNQAEDRTLVFPTSSKTGQGVVKSATTGNGQAFKKVHTIDLPREIQSLDQTRKSTAGSRLNLKSKKE